MDELNFELESVPISARTRTLKARWSIGSLLDNYVFRKIVIKRIDDYFEVSDEDADFSPQKFKVTKTEDKYFYDNIGITSEIVIEALKQFERKEKLEKLLS